MKKISLVALTFMFCAVLNAQESALQLIDDFRVMQMPQPPMPEGTEPNNSIDISFKLPAIEKVDKIIVTVKDKSTGSEIVSKTLSITLENGEYFFNYPNRKRNVKRNYVAYPEYLGSLTIDNVVIEATVIDIHGNSSNKISPDTL